MSPDDAGPGRPEAGDAFERFTRRLVGLARRQLGDLLRHKVDPEDVVQSVYKSFLLRYGAEMLAGQDEDGLWALLARITLRKCADRARYYRAECRDASREAPPPAGVENAEAWREAVGHEPTPEQAVILAETLEHLMRGLDGDERPIVELSLQGFSTQEISEQLGRAERSVRRVRERVRKHLERLQADGESW